MPDESEHVDTIAVVGGGDSGLLTALALKKGLEDTHVFVVDDFEESIPEVGKSTLSYIAKFLHGLLEIDPRRLVREVELSWKTTVYLEDWCGVDPFHSPLGSNLPIVTETARKESGGIDFREQLTSAHEAESHEFYHRYREREFSTLYTAIAESPGTAPIRRATDGSGGIEQVLGNISYQFESRSFNRFLRKLCRERGIDLEHGRIEAVDTTDGRIERIASDDAVYTADLYVDASGFKRVLMNELDNELVSFDLPVDAAVVSTVDIPQDEVVSATVVTTGDAGWFWQIDTCGSETGTRDIGYVYSSDHISEAEATEEFVAARPEVTEDTDRREYTFDSGILERPWVENCVAAGNALGFVEPLQSTALTTACFLAAHLTRSLSKHARVNHEGLRQIYNETSRATWDEVYDFISLYYKYNSGSTDFWEDARSINPEPIQQYETYEHSGFSGWTDLASLTRPGTDINGYDLYLIILCNLGVESPFYEDLDLEVREDVVDRVEAYTNALDDRVEDCLNYEEFHEEFHPGY